MERMACSMSEKKLRAKDFHLGMVSGSRPRRHFLERGSSDQTCNKAREATGARGHGRWSPLQGFEYFPDALPSGTGLAMGKT